METFTWASQAGATKAGSFRKGRNDFGDGYTQHYTVGINPVVNTWSISILEDDEADLIVDFIQRHKGIYPFLWIPPNQVAPIAVICETYNDENLGFKARRVSLTFERFQTVI